MISLDPALDFCPGQGFQTCFQNLCNHIYISIFVSETPGGKGAGAKGGAQNQNDEIIPSRLDMRIGKVVSVEKVSLAFAIRFERCVESSLCK